MTELLSGKKTYIVGILWVVTTIFNDWNVFDYDTAFTALQGAGLMTLRSALEKLK